VHVYGGSTDNYHARDNQVAKTLPAESAGWTLHPTNPQYVGQHRGQRMQVVTHGLGGVPTMRRAMAMAGLETFLLPALQTVVGNNVFSLGQGSAACRNVSPMAKYRCALPNHREARAAAGHGGFGRRRLGGCMRDPCAPSLGLQAW